MVIASVVHRYNAALGLVRFGDREFKVRCEVSKLVRAATNHVWTMPALQGEAGVLLAVGCKSFFLPLRFAAHDRWP
ncbi:MAG: hypothetical protein CMB79_10560 [Filomicrobium sp.]|nr:hypothetical protein [Filomicrobium sp.]